MSVAELARIEELEHRVGELERDLRDCREQHAASLEDRAQLRGALDALRAEVASLRVDAVAARTREQALTDRLLTRQEAREERAGAVEVADAEERREARRAIVAQIAKVIGLLAATLIPSAIAYYFGSATPAAEPVEVQAVEVAP